MSKKTQARGHYKVGYGKPPKETQFKKGQSGNRKGRPKGAANKIREDSVLTIIAREARREVLVNDGTRTLALPLIVASAKSLAQKAAKGDLRALSVLLPLLTMAEKKNLSDQAIIQKEQKEVFDKAINKLTDEEIETLLKITEKVGIDLS